MATREAIDRWRSALMDIEEFDALPTGQRARQMLSRPEARANLQLVNASPAYRVPQRMLTTPITDLWSQDPPTDPALVAILQPVYDAVLAFTPYQELLPQWDALVTATRTAREALETEPLGAPTVDEIIADMLLSLKTSLLIAGTGSLGSMTVIAQELVRRHLSFASEIALPLRQYDFATNTMVDHPSRTTLSLAAIKAIVDPKRRTTGGDGPPAAVSKQFAAQVIVDFYTDWEEYYREALADAQQCSKYDFQIDYFGDVSRLRQDYVHHRGICSNSAQCKQLTWFSQGDLMIPTPDNYLQLLTDFPAEELRQKPPPRTTGREKLSIRASLPVVREFEQLAASRPTKGDALDEALSDWIKKAKGTDD
ncbi:hypothetical protein [Mycolicibacterium novocastrense]|uniref:hypothetical protein n=1 Tax=Mycolicibacterium novocastrense TaxID=59813 RepID=UPI000A9741AF|nr:hypothetical protein [Mycolicibacterium novocastrense]